MTHSALPPELKRMKGIEPGGVRLSVGLEDWHNIIEDLRHALDHIDSEPSSVGAESMLIHRS
jgi:methionine-gamma-lyase